MTVALDWDFVLDIPGANDFVGVCKLGGTGKLIGVRANGNVRRSTDGGATWSSVATITGIQTPIASNFTLFAPQSATDTAFVFVYPTGGSGAIYRTTDAGDNWSSVYATPGTSFSAYGYSYLDLGGGTYWCAGYWTNAPSVFDGVPLLSTTDSGATWSRFGALPLWSALTTYNIGDQVSDSSASYESLTNGNIGNAPNVSPTDWQILVGHPSSIDNLGRTFSGLVQLSSGRILIGHTGVAQLFYSDDDGASWTASADLGGYVTGDENILYWTAVDMGGGVVLAAPCGGIGATGGATEPVLFRSTDSGVTWAPIDVGVTGGGTAAWLTRVADDVAVFSYENNNDDSSIGWKVTEDGGSTWLESTTADTTGDGYWWPMAQMVLADTTHIVAVGANQDLSNGHGQVWYGTLSGLPTPPVITQGMEIWRGVFTDPCGSPDDPSGLPTQGTARRYATTDLDAGGAFFSKGITREPTVTKSMVDTLWGQIATENASWEQYLDAILLEGYLEDLRGQQFTLELYDKASGFRQTKLQGVVTKADIRAGRVSFDGQNFDPSIFEQSLPRGRIETDEFPHAVDLGHPITKVIGYVAQVPCRYVNDDVLNNEFDYLVARGVVTVPFVFRQFGDSLTNVDPAEYIVSTTLYPCYTVIRFFLRQSIEVGGGGFYPIFADVLGDPAERNVARAIQALCSDTRWGIGWPVDEASFDAAAAILAPGVSGLRADGALTTVDQAQNWLAELFMFAGIRMRITSAGTIAIEVDTGETGVRLTAADGAGSATHILIDPQRTKVKMQDATRRAILHYRQDMRNPDAFFFQQTRTVNADLGKDKDFSNRFIRNHQVADRVTDRLGKRLLYAEDMVTATLPQEGRGLDPGDLVELTYPVLGLNGDAYEVTRLDVSRRAANLTLAGWNAAIFTYTPGTLPTESTGGGGAVDDPIAGAGGQPPDEPPPAPAGPPTQPAGFPDYDWGSVGMRAWQWFIDFRGYSDAYGAATTITANTVIETLLPKHKNGNYLGVRRGSIKIYDAPDLNVHPTTGKTYAIFQAGVSQRITDNGDGVFLGDVGTGPNLIDYGFGFVKVSLNGAATTPIVILYELDDVPTPAL